MKRTLSFLAILLGLAFATAWAQNPDATLDAVPQPVKLTAEEQQHVQDEMAKLVGRWKVVEVRQQEHKETPAEYTLEFQLIGDHMLVIVRCDGQVSTIRTSVYPPNRMLSGVDVHAQRQHYMLQGVYHFESPTRLRLNQSMIGFPKSIEEVGLSCIQMILEKLTADPSSAPTAKEVITGRDIQATEHPFGHPIFTQAIRTDDRIIKAIEHLPIQERMNAFLKSYGLLKGDRGVMMRTPPPAAPAKQAIILIIDPDAKQSDVVKQVVEALEKAGIGKALSAESAPAQTSKIHVTLALKEDESYEKIKHLVEVLKNAGVEQLQFQAAKAVEGESRLNVIRLNAQPGYTTDELHLAEQAITASAEQSGLEFALTTHRSDEEDAPAYDPKSSTQVSQTESSSPRPATGTKVLTLKNCVPDGLVKLLKHLNPSPSFQAFGSNQALRLVLIGTPSELATAEQTINRLQELMAQIKEGDNKLYELLRSLGTEHPDVLKLNTELEALDAEIVKLEAGLNHYAPPKRIEEFKTPPKPAPAETEAAAEPAPNATSDFQLGVVLHRTKPTEAARILKLVINDDRLTAEPEGDNIVRVKYRSATKAEVEAMASVLEQMEKPETATQSTAPATGTTPVPEPQNVSPKPVLAGAETPTSPLAEPQSVIPNLLRACARLRVTTDGKESKASGTIIKSGDETIVLTCSHIFRGMTDQTKIEVDLFDSPKPRTYVATLLGQNPESDVALIRIDTSREVHGSAGIAPLSLIPSVGNEVLSMGCILGESPRSSTRKIVQVNQFKGADNLTCTGLPEVGEAGGGLFNDQGQLIGLCTAADSAAKQGVYCGLGPIHELIKRHEPAHLADATAKTLTPNLSPEGKGEPEASTRETNQQLATAIADAMKQAGIQGRDIRVEVRDGVCSLTGQWRTPEDQTRAEKLALATPGITSVQNHPQASKVPDADSNNSSVKVFALHYAQATEVAEILKQVYDKGPAKIVPDARTNSIIVTGPEGQLQEIDALLLKLDDAGQAKPAVKVVPLQVESAKLVVQLQDEIVKLQQDLGDQHPKIVELQARLLAAREAAEPRQPAIPGSLEFTAILKQYQAVIKEIQLLEDRMTKMEKHSDAYRPNDITDTRLKLRQAEAKLADIERQIAAPNNQLKARLLRAMVSSLCQWQQISGIDRTKAAEHEASITTLIAQVDESPSAAQKAALELADRLDAETSSDIENAMTLADESMAKEAQAIKARGGGEVINATEVRRQEDRLAALRRTQEARKLAANTTPQDAASESAKRVVQLQDELAELRQLVANGEGEAHTNAEWNAPDREMPYENPTPINAATLSSDEVMAHAGYAHMLIAELQKERDSVKRDNPTSPRIASLDATIGVIESMYADVFTEVAKAEAKSIEDRTEFDEMLPKILRASRAELDRLIKENPTDPRIRELDIMHAQLNIQRQAQQLAAETIFGRTSSATAAIALPATDQSPKELQQQLAQLRKEYQAADQQARQLAEQLKLSPDELKQAKLRKAVQRAFTARQSLLRAELLEMQTRLLQTQRSIEMRERISDQIIQRRVEDLLNPQLEWEGSPTAPGHPLSKSRTGESGSSEIRGSSNVTNLKFTYRFMAAEADFNIGYALSFSVPIRPGQSNVFLAGLPIVAKEPNHAPSTAPYRESVYSVEVTPEQHAAITSAETLFGRIGISRTAPKEPTVVNQSCRQAVVDAWREKVRFDELKDAVGPAVEPTQADPEAEALAKLQGKWHLTSRSPGPVLSNPETYEAEAEVEGNLMKVFYTKELDASIPEERFLAHTVMLRVQRSEGKPQIDLLFGPNEEKVNRFLALGITEFSEDVIRLCFDRSTDSESIRPEVFAVGAKAAIWELRRTPQVDSKAGILARLQGLWVAEFETDPNTVDPAEAKHPGFALDASDVVFDVSGNVVTTSYITPHPDKPEWPEFSLQLGGIGKPQPVDLLWKTSTDPEGDGHVGIMEFSGEEVRLCFGDVKDRPQTFAAVKDYIYLVRLKRPSRESALHLGVQPAASPVGPDPLKDTPFRGGLRIEKVYAGTPAAEGGLVAGDILVGLGAWEVAKLEDLQYALGLSLEGEVSFHVLRDGQVRKGYVLLDGSKRPASDAGLSPEQLVKLTYEYQRGHSTPIAIADPNVSLLGNLQGVWKAEFEFEEDFKEKDNSYFVDKSRFVVEVNHDLMSVRKLDGNGQLIDQYAMLIRLGDVASPQPIDLIREPEDTQKRSELKGIIELKYGQVSICFGDAVDRPKSFGTLQSGIQRLRLRRPSSKSPQGLGVTLDLDPIGADKMPQQFRGGVRIDGNYAGGAAEKGGIRSGDILVGLGDWEIAGWNDLQSVIKKGLLGEIPYYIVRDGVICKGYVRLNESESMEIAAPIHLAQPLVLSDPIVDLQPVHHPVTLDTLQGSWNVHQTAPRSEGPWKIDIHGQRLTIDGLDQLQYEIQLGEGATQPIDFVINPASVAVEDERQKYKIPKRLGIIRKEDGVIRICFAPAGSEERPMNYGLRVAEVIWELRRIAATGVATVLEGDWHKVEHLGHPVQTSERCNLTLRGDVWTESYSNGDEVICRLRVDAQEKRLFLKSENRDSEVDYRYALEGSRLLLRLSGQLQFVFERGLDPSIKVAGRPSETMPKDGLDPILAKLQGSWDMHMIEADPNPPGGKEEAVIEGDLMTITITLDGKSVSIPVQLKLDGSPELHETLLDGKPVLVPRQQKTAPAGSPQPIDLIHWPNDKQRREVLPGIIEFRDDSVRICLANSSKGERPEVFAVGKDANIWELRRKPAVSSASELEGDWHLETQGADDQPPNNLTICGDQYTVSSPGDTYTLRMTLDPKAHTLQLASPSDASVLTKLTYELHGNRLTMRSGDPPQVNVWSRGHRSWAVTELEGDWHLAGEHVEQGMISEFQIRPSNLTVRGDKFIQAWSGHQVEYRLEVEPKSGEIRQYSLHEENSYHPEKYERQGDRLILRDFQNRQNYRIYERGHVRLPVALPQVTDTQRQKWRSGIVELFTEWNDEKTGTQQKPIGYGTVISDQGWVVGQVERIGPDTRKYIARCDDGSLVRLDLKEDDVNGGWFVFQAQSSTQFNHAFPIALTESEVGDAVWAYPTNSTLPLITARLTSKDRRVVASGLPVWQLDRQTIPAEYSETKYGSLPILNGKGELLGLSMVGTGELSLALPVSQFKTVFTKSLGQPAPAVPVEPTDAEQTRWRSAMVDLYVANPGEDESKATRIGDGVIVSGKAEIVAYLPGKSDLAAMTISAEFADGGRLDLELGEPSTRTTGNGMYCFRPKDERFRMIPNLLSFLPLAAKVPNQNVDRLYIGELMSPATISHGG